VTDAEMKTWLRAASNVAPLLPPEVALDGWLAEGGQGAVYKGSANGTPAAIKIYFPGQLQQRIDREVEALRHLVSPTIVQLLWSGSIKVDGNDLPVVATSLVPGVPLNTVLQKRRLDGDEVGRLSWDVAHAIDQMWNRRIVHRDLKPQNILLKPNGRTCVIDLGLARHVDRSSLTAAGMTWGTYGYMSPEQTKTVRQLTCKSDLFALGVIAVEAALGRHPTNYDQLRLLGAGLHERLPAEVAGWKHASLLAALLQPRPTSRPLPADVVITLAEYAQV